MTVLTSVSQALEAPLEGTVLVPTMGALHSGHVSLVRAASELGKPVTVSIFVNPTQFGPNEDFTKYPRDLDADLRQLESERVSWIFAPSTSDIYPRTSTMIRVPEVTEYYEGAHRAGHFDGVATIVCKLFQICRPSAAIFGLKDLQQCAVIKRMVSDLNLGVRLIFQETIREEDGLAKSSRNIYLTKQERSIAPVLNGQIRHCAEVILGGAPVEKTLSEARSLLTESGFDVDYFDLVDVDWFRKTESVSSRSAIVAAARLGSTRLIDNRLLFANQSIL
jgi:pantoate--beta-alanine ligase